MQIIPAQFGKSWQVVRQSFGNPFAGAFAGNDRRQSTATQLPAMFGNLWHCVFFADLHYTLCRQTAVCHSCHNTEIDGKVVGNCLAIFSALGLPAKYWRSYPPEFVVKEPLTICELHLVTCDDAPSDCTNSY